MILFLLACQNEPESTKPEPTEQPYLVPDEDQGGDAPVFEADTIERAIDEAIEVFHTLDPAPIIAAYDAVLAEADGGCPAWYTSDGMPFWADSCTTKSGTTFDGYGYRVNYDGYFDGYTTYSGAAIGAVANIETADGDFFTINGTVFDLQGENTDGMGVAYTQITGDIEYSGNPTPGVVPTFTRAVYALPGGVGINIDGSVSGLSGELEATAFDDVYLIDEGTGMSDCSDEPSGVISVLEHESGAWIDLVFDPHVEENAIATENGSDCDGCAAAWWGSQYLGQACADFSPWLQQ
jgi:hypothetical protein